VQVGADAELRARIGEARGDLLGAIGGVAQLLGERRQIELAVGVDDVSDELRTLPHEEAAATQQVARLPLGPRIDVSERKHAAAEHVGELAGVDLVALGLAAVDVLHGQGVAENEGDAFVFAEVGEPVPGEHALTADDEVFAKGFDGVEEGVGLGGQIAFEDGFAFGAEDVHEHGSGVQIDAGVELVWRVVIRHVGLLVCDGSS